VNISQTVFASQLEFPVYLSLEKLAWALQAQSTDVYDAIAHVLQTEYALSDTFTYWLMVWLPTHPVLYLFDEKEPSQHLNSLPGILPIYRVSGRKFSARIM